VRRWEYRVVSLRKGQYTAALNDYGREGWELVGVTSEPRDVPAPPESSGGLPLPRPFGKLEDAAARLGKLGTDASTEAQADTPASDLLWVLRRPLDED
jgi:Domain of unknown function (DUF4177)